MAEEYDWDAFAGVAAAVVALILHMFHIVEAELLLPITVVLVTVQRLVHPRGPRL
jgi:hypothetical protein